MIFCFLDLNAYSSLTEVHEILEVFYFELAKLEKFWYMYEATRDWKTTRTIVCGWEPCWLCKDTQVSESGVRAELQLTCDSTCESHPPNFHEGTALAHTVPGGP